MHLPLLSYKKQKDKNNGAKIKGFYSHPHNDYSKDVWLEEIEYIFRKMPIIKNKIKTYLKETNGGFTTLQVIIDGRKKNQAENKKYEITIRLIENRIEKGI